MSNTKNYLFIPGYLRLKVTETGAEICYFQDGNEQIIEIKHNNQEEAMNLATKKVYEHFRAKIKVPQGPYTQFKRWEANRRQTSLF